MVTPGSDGYWPSVEAVVAYLAREVAPQTRAEVAAHEATHAVTAWALGIPGVVTLEPAAFTIEDPTPYCRRAGAVVSVAGRLADEAAGRDYPFAFLPGRDACDNVNLLRLLAEEGRGDPWTIGVETAEALRRARAIVAAHQAEVEAVAAALLERGRLDPDELVALLGPFRAAPAPRRLRPPVRISHAALVAVAGALMRGRPYAVGVFTDRAVFWTTVGELAWVKVAA